MKMNDYFSGMETLMTIWVKLRNKEKGSGKFLDYSRLILPGILITGGIHQLRVILGISQYTAHLSHPFTGNTAISPLERHQDSIIA